VGISTVLEIIGHFLFKGDVLGTTPYGHGYIPSHVAIGHKLEKYENNEWRISFSLAQQTLVYSMNHCQFLTTVC
jgi:hypothetical protein